MDADHSVVAEEDPEVVVVEASAEVADVRTFQIVYY